MKTLLFIFLLVFSIFNAQTIENLESDIKKLETASNWDEIILKSAEIIALEPLRPEGYYYTAYSYYIQTQFDKAKNYADKAFLYGNDNWKSKTEILNQKITHAQLLIPSPIDVKEVASLSGEKWKKFWELDKSNTDAGINAVESYINIRQNMEAYKIISDSSFDRVAGVDDLRSRLREDKIIATNSKVDNLKKSAQRKKSNKDFKGAVKDLEEIYKIDPTATNKIDLDYGKDDLSWYEAEKANNVEAYEDYLKKPGYKRYEKSANAKIFDYLKIRVDRYSKLGDVENAEINYYHYITNYTPSPEHKQEMTQSICEMYRNQVFALEDSRKTVDKQKKLDLLLRARKVCILTDKEKKEIKRLE